jgi:hypothetical protein
VARAALQGVARAAARRFCRGSAAAALGDSAAALENAKCGGRPEEEGAARRLGRRGGGGVGARERARRRRGRPAAAAATGTGDRNDPDEGSSARRTRETAKCRGEEGGGRRGAYILPHL